MKLITFTLFATVVAQESNPSIGIVGRDHTNYSLLWKPSQEEAHGLFTDLDIMNSCADENYELKLAVHAQPHAFFVSVPKDDETNCPPLMWHADFVDPKKKDTLEKSVYTYDDITIFVRSQ